MDQIRINLPLGLDKGFVGFKSTILIFKGLSVEYLKNFYFIFLVEQFGLIPSFRSILFGDQFSLFLLPAISPTVEVFLDLFYIYRIQYVQDLFLFLSTISRSTQILFL